LSPQRDTTNRRQKYRLFLYFVHRLALFICDDKNLLHSNGDCEIPNRWDLWKKESSQIMMIISEKTFVYLHPKGE